MPSEKPLSQTMASALLEITGAGGRVERRPGGYWVLPNAKWNGSSWGQWWGTTTIEALVSRGKLAYCEHQENKRGSFPVAAAVVGAP